jgi:protein tyrosine/serine phosphatase
MSHKSPPPKLRHVANFRDFGGYPTRSGGVVARGRLYRSGHLAEAGPEDRRALGALNITHVADLRRPEERAKSPTPEALAARWRTLCHNHPTNTTDPPHLAVLLAPDVSDASITARMLKGYTGYPYDPALSEVYRAYFAALADGREDEAVLVHCHAGKDRTGWLVALTHHILGVSPDALMADYLRTNAESRIDERLPDILEGFRKDHGVVPPISALKKVMQVEEGYLQTAFQSVADRHGSVDAYLARHLDLEDKTLARIRERLIL